MAQLRHDVVGHLLKDRDIGVGISDRMRYGEGPFLFATGCHVNAPVHRVEPGELTEGRVLVLHERLIVGDLDG